MWHIQPEESSQRVRGGRIIGSDREAPRSSPLPEDAAARSVTAERTHAGMKEARLRRVKFGRKPKLSPPQIAKARKPINHGERVQDVAAVWNVNRATLCVR